jgi:hypothetical protein
MFRKDLSVTTGQQSTTATSSSQVSQLPPSSPSSYHTPPPGDEEESHVSPRQTNARGKPICNEPGCKKVQQSSLCINNCCNEHCAELTIRNHFENGKNIRLCPLQAHQQAADRKLNASTTSTSPRRLRIGPSPLHLQLKPQSPALSQLLPPPV